MPKGDDAIATVALDTHGSGDSWLVLTPSRVIAHLDRGFMGHTETSVPLHAIDSVVLGWKRLQSFAIAAIVCLALAITLTDNATFAIVLALANAAVFWFYRPSQLLVRSGKESLGGKPKSKPEAERFVALLTGQLQNRNNSSGDT
jgi:hypothetical protein